MQRIEILSRRFQWFFMMLFWAIPVVHLLVWLTLGPRVGEPSNWEFDFSGLWNVEILAEPSWAARAMGFAASMLSGGFTMAAMWCLARLFGQFSQGDLFTGRTVHLLRRAGIMLILAQLAEPVSAALCSVAATLGNPVGQRMLTVGLEDADFVGVVLGLALCFGARLMDEARLLRESDALTI